ncbi:hypothetical protein ECP03052938_0008 [Escherichia coli p0305293.8]|nr:hypothetical protein ECP03052938_0008 [Escherichia coli p0305293.8]
MKKAVCFQQDLHQASVHDRRMRRERLIRLPNCASVTIKNPLAL